MVNFAANYLQKAWPLQSLVYAITVDRLLLPLMIKAKYGIIWNVYGKSKPTQTDFLKTRKISTKSAVHSLTYITRITHHLLPNIRQTV